VSERKIELTHEIWTSISGQTLINEKTHFDSKIGNESKFIFGQKKRKKLRVFYKILTPIFAQNWVTESTKWTDSCFD